MCSFLTGDKENMVGLIKKETLKTAALLGLGIAAISRDKLNELADELSRTEKINEKEGRALVDSIIKKAETSRGELEAKIRKELQANIRSSRLVSMREVEALEKKVEVLERKLAGRVASRKKTSRRRHSRRQ